MKCNVCGTESNRLGMYCPACGKQYDREIGGTNRQAELLPCSGTLIGDTLKYPDESEYFGRQFAQFDHKGGYVVTFNWVPFVIAPVWYIYKGMWGKAFLLMVIFHVSGGLAAPLLWCYAGFVGNYDYYLKKAKGTQWW